jgi:hypothetical protein
VISPSDLRASSLAASAGASAPASGATAQTSSSTAETTEKEKIDETQKPQLSSKSAGEGFLFAGAIVAVAFGTMAIVSAIQKSNKKKKEKEQAESKSLEVASASSDCDPLSAASHTLDQAAALVQ